MDKYVALIGLGAVGAPLANLLYKKYAEDFLLLSSEEFLWTLTEKDIYINDELFAPTIVTNKTQLKKKIGVLFVCVKNYHVAGICTFLKDLVDEDTIILPLQNGVYSFDYVSKAFPNNITLEGFAKGPNTKIVDKGFEYQKPGLFHIGATATENKAAAEYVHEIMTAANVECYYDDNIRYEVWKKLMLNVAGNAITAITEIDYCMFEKSVEVQDLCRRTMTEFIAVAKTKQIELTQQDMEDVIRYFLSFTVSKHTSMLEDVLNNRPTENEYIAGYISKLAKSVGIYTPNIDMLYSLVKIKEDVYMKRI